jgi:hypothetical protein
MLDAMDVADVAGELHSCQLSDGVGAQQDDEIAQVEPQQDTRNPALPSAQKKIPSPE